MGLSAIIVTDKKDSDIRPTLESVAFADEIIREHFKGDFSLTRNSALAKAKGDWVLFVDDDEIVTKELADEIKRVIGDGKHDAFYVPRRDIISGQKLNHGETGNIKIIRLARKSAGKFARPVHEIWEIKGRVGELKNPLLHYRLNYVSSFIDRVAFYGPLDAKTLKKENKPFTYWRLLLYPKVKFFVNYVLKLGFLDGYLGLFQAYLMSVQSLSVRVFQWQRKSFSK